MNIILLYPEDFISKDHVRISGPRRIHIRQVLKTNKDESLNMGIVNGPMGKGKLVQHEKEADVFFVTCADPPPDPLPLTVLLALPRPKVFRRVLQSITSLGIKHIVFFNAYRVEKSYWQSPFLSNASLLEQCTAGLQQAKDTVFPKIEMESRFKPFVEDRLPAILNKKTGYLAHPYANKTFPSTPHLPAVLAIGPEGGFIPFELELMNKAGMSSFSLGKRILRVETAVSVLISRFI